MPNRHYLARRLVNPTVETKLFAFATSNFTRSKHEAGAFAAMQVIRTFVSRKILLLRCQPVHLTHLLPTVPDQVFSPIGIFHNKVTSKNARLYGLTSPTYEFKKDRLNAEIIGAVSRVCLPSIDSFVNIYVRVGA